MGFKKLESPKLLYIGSSKKLQSYVVPNVGLDYPIFHLVDQAIEQVNVNRVLMMF